MLRWLLIGLALAFAVHHTALAVSAPAAAHAHHGQACADCQDHGLLVGALAACVALVAGILGLPRVRSLLTRLVVVPALVAGGGGHRAALSARPPPRPPGLARLCVLRC
jgi:hypothetical protein